MLVATNVLGKVLSIIIWAYAARLFNPTEFALLGYLRNVQSTLISALNFGYTNYIIKKTVNKGAGKKQLLLRTFGAYIAIFGGISFFIATIVGIYNESQLPWYLYGVGAVSAISILYIQVIIALTQAGDKFESTILFNFYPLSVALGLLFCWFVFDFTFVIFAFSAINVSFALIYYSYWRITNPQRSQYRLKYKVILGHWYCAFRLTGFPFIAGIPLIFLKLHIETSFMLNQSSQMAMYYLSYMIFSTSMTILNSASQPLFIRINKFPEHSKSFVNTFSNFLLMLLISSVVLNTPQYIFEYYFANYDPKELNYYINLCVVLALTMSIRQGFGRLMMVYGKTSGFAWDNIITTLILLIFAFWGYKDPSQYLIVTIICSVISNLIFGICLVEIKGRRIFIEIGAMMLVLGIIVIKIL